MLSLYNAENIKKLDTNIHIAKTLQKGKKEGPGVQSRLEERKSKKEQKGSYREMLDNVFEVKRSI